MSSVSNSHEILAYINKTHIKNIKPQQISDYVEIIWLLHMPLLFLYWYQEYLNHNNVLYCPRNTTSFNFKMYVDLHFILLCLLKNSNVNRKYTDRSWDFQLRTIYKRFTQITYINGKGRKKMYLNWILRTNLLTSNVKSCPDMRSQDQHWP